MKRLLALVSCVVCLAYGMWQSPEIAHEARPQQSFEEWCQEQDSLLSPPPRPMKRDELLEALGIDESELLPTRETTRKTEAKAIKKRKIARNGTMPSYEVTGAGTAGVNGIYVDSGETYNGRPIYRKDAGYWMQWMPGWETYKWILYTSTIDEYDRPLYTRNEEGDGVEPAGIWGVSNNGEYPVPTVTESTVEGDTIKPIFSSANVASDGNSVAVTLTEADSAPILPASGVTGFTVLVGGVARTISNATAAGSIVTLNLASPVYVGEVVTVSYAPGNVEDSVGNTLNTFSAQGVMNSSTKEAPVNVPFHRAKKSFNVASSVIYPGVVLHNQAAEEDLAAKRTLQDAAGNMAFGVDESTTSGLTWGFLKTAVKRFFRYPNGSESHFLDGDVPAGTVELTAESTNYVELDRVTREVSANAIGFTPERLPLWQVETDSVGVTSYTDRRTWLPSNGTVTEI